MSYDIERCDYSSYNGTYRRYHDYVDMEFKLSDYNQTKINLKKYQWVEAYCSFTSWFRLLDDQTVLNYIFLISEREERDRNITSESYCILRQRLYITDILYTHYILYCYDKYLLVRDYWYRKHALEPYLVKDVIDLIHHFNTLKDKSNHIGKFIEDPDLFDLINKR